jgi:hypothetical protein
MRLRRSAQSWSPQVKESFSRLPPNEKTGPGFLRPHPIFATEPSIIISGFYDANSSRSDLAPLKSGVSNPSVNQSWISTSD